MRLCQWNTKPWALLAIIVHSFVMALTEIAVIQTVPAVIEIKNIYLNRFLFSKQYTSGLSIESSHTTLFSFYRHWVHVKRTMIHCVILKNFAHWTYMMTMFLFQPDPIDGVKFKPIKIDIHKGVIKIVDEEIHYDYHINNTSLFIL